MTERILCISAHADDTEIMAASEICRAYYDEKIEFFTCITTDGGNMQVRGEEQKNAAKIGKYSGLSMLNRTSSEVKDENEFNIIKDYFDLINKIKPAVIITHNPFDTHATHKAVFNKVIEAVKKLPLNSRPVKLLGGEVWGSLAESGKKIIIKAITDSELYEKLMKCFKSQEMIIEGFLNRKTNNYLDMTELIQLECRYEETLG